jgi:hypothetical protein
MGGIRQSVQITTWTTLASGVIGSRSLTLRKKFPKRVKNPLDFLVKKVHPKRKKENDYAGIHESG